MHLYLFAAQPPGIPEITKKSLSEYSVNGKVELFIIGKHFLKDTKVVFEGELLQVLTVTLIILMIIITICLFNFYF